MPNKITWSIPVIYGSSSDPVLIKKIDLRIWTLRSEIESVINERSNSPEENKDPKVSDLIKEYQPRDTEKSEKMIDDILPNADLDTGEDEMARAIAAAERGEDPDAEQENKVSAGADELLEPMAQISEALEIDSETTSDGSVIIKQRRPNIAKEHLHCGKTILSEVYMDQMYFFCDHKFMPGQSIVIEFLIPNTFCINADVAFCRTFSMRSRIIGQNRLPFRIGVNFTYLKEGERTLLRQFVSSIEPEVAVAEQKAAGNAASGDGDGDEELDIFDDL